MKPADRVWRSLVNRVMDQLDGWKRRVTEVTGMPFSRVRILRRLADAPLTLSALAEAANIDAPAATVAINELEKRGYVIRQPHPTNGRMKLVSLTAKGREIVAKEASVGKDAPPSIASLSAQDLKVLARIVELLEADEY